MGSSSSERWIGGYAYAKSGRRREAEEVIRKFGDIEKTQYVVHTFVASIYGALGDKVKAFAELEKAFGQRDAWLKWIKSDPMMDPLRDDPRFTELMSKVTTGHRSKPRETPDEQSTRG